MTLPLFGDPSERDFEEQFLEDVADEVKHHATSVLEGRKERFEQIAAEFAHLGAVTDALLALALHDVETTPDYFAQVTRMGLRHALRLDEPSHEKNVIEGTATPKSAKKETTDE